MDDARRALTHDEAAAELPAAALGALSADALAAVLAHAEVCPACTTELASLRTVASRLDEHDAARLDASRAAAQRARLVDRARAEASRGIVIPVHEVHEVHDAPRRPRRSTPGAPAVIADIPRAPRGGLSQHDTPRGEHVVVPASTPHHRRSTPRRWTMPAAALAASAAFVLAAVGYLAERQEANRLRTELSVSERTRQADLAVLQTALRERDAEMARLTGPDVRVVDLASNGTALPHARMFWDVSTNSWTLVGHRVPTLPAGRTYQVWLVTAHQKLSAGTFEPSPSGQAMYRTSYPLNRSALTAVAITVEPTGGVPVATGPVVLLGAVR